MPRPPKFAHAALATLGCAAVLVACSSAPAAPAATTGASSTASAASAAPPASATAVASSAASPASAAPVGASVDLTMTGPYAATAKGTAGCKNVVASGATFFWQAGEHDYPGLYDGMQIAESSTHDTIDIKWIIRGSIVYVLAAPVAYAGDGHTVTVDTDLKGSDGTTAHVKGTVTCP